jgi:hypothetical protein
VIAEPDSTTTTSPAASVEASPLSAAELYQLTLYKWRYSLEAYGFDSSTVRELMFLKWLYSSHHLPS